MHHWFALITALSAAGTSAQPCQVYDFSAVSNHLEANLDRVGPEGVGLAIIQDGELIYAETFGNLTPTTTLDIASASKLLSAAVVMTLVDDGSLSLSSTAASTGAPFPPVLADATLAEMFSHTSGITPDPAINRLWQFQSMEACVDAIATLPAASVPGEAVNYGGNSMQVGARLAEIASGQDWAALADQRIFQPTDMENTDYLAFSSGAPTQNPAVAASARSSLAEYSNFMTMIDNRGVYRARRVLSEDAIGEMFRVQRPDARVDHSPYTELTSLYPRLEQLEPGLGCFVETPRQPEQQPTRFVSQGAWGTSAYVDREREISLIFFTERREYELVGPGVISNPAFLVFFELRDILEDLVPTQRTPASLADVNKDNSVNGLDFGAWLNAFTNNAPTADQNRDGVINGIDFGAWLGNYSAACPAP